MAGAALLAALAALTFGWLKEPRPAFTGIPTPRPFARITTLEVPPGSRACQRSVAFETDTRAALVLSSPAVRRGPKLRIEARGPGYRSADTLPAGHAGGLVLTGELSAPPRSLLGELCVVNLGPGPARLQGTTETRVESRSPTRVDGRPHRVRMTLLLTEGYEQTLRFRAGEVLGHVAAYRPWWAGRGAVAAIAVLVLAGIPALLVLALWTSAVGAAQPEDAQQERGEEDL